MHDAATHDAIDTVWRLESAKVIGAVARLTHDVGIAEELAGDALVAALEHWPRDGVPANPGAWLTTTAKRRALDWLRHRSMAAAEHEALARDDEARQAMFVPSVMDTLMATEADPVGDDLLRLVFAACHPVLGARRAGGADPEARRRPEHRGDRACVPGERIDGRATHRSCQAQPE